ncbi:MAG: anti-sigma factor family protein [Deltaproteobacteria bacterium]
MAQCEGFDIQLSAYVDGELEELGVAGVEAHLKDCPACARRVEGERSLRAAFRTHLAPLRAPDELRADVREAIAVAGREAAASGKPGTRPRRAAQWLALAATIAVAVLGGRQWALWSLARRAAPLDAELLTAHLRSLQLSHLTDVPSSDHHTVKPWFAGKLDYSPPVPELDSLGFRLIGGRLDYVRDRPTAVIVYGRRRHIINLFLWPSGDSTAATTVETDRGYNSVHGAGGGIAYWAISDLDATELRQFVGLAMKGR